MARGVATAVAALLVVLAGCSGANPASPPEGAVPSVSTTTSVVVPATTQTPSERVVGPGDRPARLVLPPTWSEAGEPRPLVVVLHGYGAGGDVQDLYLGVSSRGEDLGYATLIPDGTTDPGGNRFWNVTGFDGLVDDTAYLADLIAEAVASFNLDPERVFLVGHSNGGFMAHQLACERPEVVAGLASIAGGIVGMGDDCVEPVPAIVIHGTADGTVPFDGGAFLGGRLLGAAETAARWVDVNVCASPPAEAGPFDFDFGVPGDETTISAWADCASGATTELWVMEGSGHIPAFRPGFRTAVIEALLGRVQD